MSRYVDSYRPNRLPASSERERYRNRDDYGSRRGGQYDDLDDYRRNRSRSRSPARRLDYDDSYVPGRRHHTEIESYRPFPGGGPRGRYDGKKDVSTEDTPLTLVLVRKFGESITEVQFAQTMEGLYRDDENAKGATKDSLRRVLIIRDRETDESMGFGFAEYYKVADAKAAVSKAREIKSFQIGSKIVEIGFPHNGVFPQWSFGRHELTAKFRTTLLTSSHEHKYHDERYYASEEWINKESPYKTDGIDIDKNPAATGESKTKKKKKTTKAREPAAPAHLKVWQNKTAELREEDTAGLDGGQDAYRDRAAERRKEEALAPQKVGFSLKGIGQKKKGGASASSSDNESSKPYGKGFDMLQKSGWTEGQGLGAGGGITAPIEQSVFAPGVGLGHESSKKGDAMEEATRLTRNRGSDFVEKTRENAKKRFEQMK